MVVFGYTTGRGISKTKAFFEGLLQVYIHSLQVEVYYSEHCSY